MTVALQQEQDIGVAIDATGMIQGTVPAAMPDLPLRIEILLDGQHVATVPLLGTADGRDPAFSCRLPPVSHAVEGRLELRDADRRRIIYRQDHIARTPYGNSANLPASTVYRPHAAPMFAAPWISFDGARLVVSGAHLPPGGDPARLSVTMQQGVAFAFQYPLPGNEFGAHFWYWPNAHLSNFILTIDLASSAWGADPFQFDFVYQPAAGEAPAGTPLRQRVWIPSDLQAFVGHPTETSQLQRVQTYSTVQSVSFTGYNVFRALETILHRHGIDRRKRPTILDWGCGHGRVSRHFIQFWPEAEVTGADIDQENVAWCAANLYGGRYVHVPLMPPTGLPAGAFDAVFGISVMTHLTETAQHVWLIELRRILKPGGLALLTFGSDSAVAWGSFWQDEAWWAAWIAAGFDDGIPDPALAGKIGDDTYYRHTVQTEDWVRRAWAAHFEIVSIETDLIGNQCLAVLRRR